MFAYCENDPVNRADPNGEDWHTVLGVGLIITAIGLAALLAIPTGGGSLALAGAGIAAATATAVATAAAEATIATGAAIAGGALIAAATQNGGRHSTQVGRDGERQAGILNNKGKTPFEYQGRTRVPDAEGPGWLMEVKNVRYIANTLQLRDYAWYASSKSLKMYLVVRETTIVASSVEKAGWTVLRILT